MELKEVIMKRFLRKLMNLNMWGGKHTEIKNLQKTLPNHLRGTKEMKKAIKELINLRFLNILLRFRENLTERKTWVLVQRP